MPQTGEIRKGQNETVVWDGSRWQPMPHEQSGTSAIGDAAARFAGGFVDKTPFNPLNALHAILHPIDTVGGAVADTLHGVQDAATHASNAITNPGNEGWLGRLTEAVQAAKSAGSAVPFVGRTATDAGDKIGNGDVAGGLGDIAGLASGAALPKATARVPGALQTVGGAMERGGTALTDASMHSPLGRVTIPAAGLADVLLRHDPYGAAVAAAPYALKYGGRAVGALGDMLDGLTKSPIVGEVVPDAVQDGEFSEVKPGTGMVATGQNSGPRYAGASSAQPAGALPPAGQNLLPARSAYQMPASSERFMSDINPHELGYSGSLPDTEGVSTVEPGEPPSREGQAVPSASDVDELIRGLVPQQPEAASTSTPAAASPSLRALDRGDEFWGPGTLDRTGGLSMADEGGRTIYDPQTPTSYLRDQLSSATDDADRAFLAKAIRQRYNIQRRPGNAAPIAVNQ